MNLVGKIFIVLILLMSLTFMGFAVAVYSTHQNWSELVNHPSTGYKAKLAAMTLERNQKEAQIKELDERRKAELAARQDKLTAAETERNELRREHDALVNEHATLVQQARASVATMETTQQTLAAMRTEVDGLRTDIRKSQTERDEKFKEVVKLTDEFNQAQSELKRLKTQSAVLADQIAHQRAIANQLGVNLNIAPQDQVVKADGIVEASNQKDGLVEISLGSDDGVKRGTLLNVKRGARYIGRIEVVEPAPEKSVARVLKEFRKAQIERNDVVTTPID
jgi:chromosome segregation ATPase